MMRAARPRQTRRELAARGGTLGSRVARPQAHTPGALRREGLRRSSGKRSAGTPDGLAPPRWLARLLSNR
jgi:hypothetical protein